jgi:hypothetical protein
MTGDVIICACCGDAAFEVNAGLCSECYWGDRDDDDTEEHVEVSRYPDDWDVLRREVYARDGYKCVNCLSSTERLHAHHIVPAARGGTHALSNLATLCESCHIRTHPHMATHVL